MFRNVLVRLSLVRLVRGRMRRLGLAGAVLLAALLAFGASRAPAPAAGSPAPAPAAGSPVVSPLYANACWVELSALLLLALVGSSSSIAEERQRGTWEALALTQLTDREIVVGKLGGALVPGLMLIAGALPSHLIASGRGMVPLLLVAKVHLVMLMAPAAAAAIGVAVSSFTRRTMHAVALAAAAMLFGWFGTLDLLGRVAAVAAIAGALHPMRLLGRLLPAEPLPPLDTPSLPPFLVGSGLLITLGVAVGIGLVRRPPARERAWSGPWAARADRPALEVWDHPVLWRECRLPGGRRLSRATWIVALSLVATFALVRGGWTWPGVVRSVADNTFGLMQIMVAVAATAVCLRASHTIADERARGMIEPLQLAGVGPGELAWSKHLGILLGTLAPLATVLALALVGLGLLRGRLGDASIWLGSLGLFGAGLLYLHMLAALCLYVSSRARSSQAAFVLGGIILLSTYFGAALLPAVSFLIPDPIPVILAALSPPILASAVMAHATGAPTFLTLGQIAGLMGFELILGVAALGLTTWRMQRKALPARTAGPVAPNLPESPAHA